MLDATHNPTPGHERRDVAVKRLLLFGAGLCVMVLFALVSMWLLFGYYKAEQSPGPPQAQEQKTPPEPRLQVTEQADLQKQRKAEDAVLTSYGWVDQPTGIVRIPIDRAIELLAQRGLPAREAKR